ncbi:MAG TPA: hypothetical protein PK677_12960 [Acidiphilium sp.]|nr:MAG: hypothetical protein B7Z67_05525 [Acidiphilium sp. 21-60-14]OYV89928.1 MAG: hypothetical protein B7Z57_10590 [Acidiphilium sp. 37-60-79]HQT89445.1 hypothetical protein [Acidiphilium sp.]HQU24715.1 hypothetical protein [Acidiphilium sp.]
MTDESTPEFDLEDRQFGHKSADRRRERRRSIVGRVRLILETPGAPSYEYLLLEASDHGYRLSGAPVPDVVAPGEVSVELADGSMQRMAVRWVEQGEVGLEVIGT